MAASEHPMALAVTGAVVGALLGLALSAVVYGVLVAALEEAGDPWVQLKGFAWNIVPLSSIAGAGVGWWSAQRWLRGRAGR